MNVLIVNKFLFQNGGSETYIFRLGEELQKQGHEVQYFGMDHPQRCVGNRINVYTSNMDFHTGSIFSKINYPIKTIYSVEARKKIRLVLDDFKPDVVHLNNFNYQLTPAIILEIVKWKEREEKKCKIIYTAHDLQLVCPNHLMRNPNKQENCEKCLYGNYFNCLKGRCIHGSFFKSLVGCIESMLWHKIYNIYNFIDIIICPSMFIKSKLECFKELSGKTVFLRNFNISVKCDISEKQNYVLYVGRYSEEKGIRTLIEVCKSLYDIPFVFAGRGPLENLIDKIPNIKNVGYKTGDELSSIIRGANFSVFPSECYENCPFSIMESQALGTPVIGSNIGGVPELIEQNITGELFPANSPIELADIIRKLYDNERKIAIYSKNCRLIIRDDIKKYVFKMLEHYSL